MIFFIDLESSALFAALSFDSPALILFDLSDAVALLFNLLFNHNNASNHDSNDEQGNNLGCIFFHFIRKFFKKSIFGASILSIAVHDLSSTIAVSINGTAVTLLVHVGTT